MGFGKRPTPPDPMQTAQQQQQFNRDSMRDATGFNQIGQDTPFGSSRALREKLATRTGS